MDAFRIVVHGFGDQAAGDKLLAKLDQIGFEIDHAIDGASDSTGGLIETQITPTIGLDPETIADIASALAGVADEGVKLELEVYTKTKDVDLRLALADLVEQKDGPKPSKVRKFKPRIYKP